MKAGKKRIISLWFIVVFVFLVLILLLYSLSHRSSFSMDKIRPGRDFSFQVTKSDSEEEIAALRAVICQPFTFLAEGNDTYVFVSADDRYVLKFFKMKNITPKYWLNYIPVPWLDKKRVSKISGREIARHQVFGSFKIAFEQFRYQTGLVFLHLFRTSHLKMKVFLTDPNGVVHKVSLDGIPFAFQRKAKTLPDYINSCLADGNEEEAVHFLYSILVLVKEGCKKGFVNYSDRVGMDYGFLDGRAVYIGVSPLVLEEAKSSRSTLKEVFRVSCSLDAWLQSHHPTLAPKFQDEVQDLFSLLEEE